MKCKMHLLNPTAHRGTVVGKDPGIGSIPTIPKFLPRHQRPKLWTEWHRFECPKCDREHFLKLRWIQNIENYGQDPNICSDCRLTKREEDRQTVHAACRALALRRKELGVKW